MGRVNIFTSFRLYRYYDDRLRATRRDTGNYRCSVTRRYRFCILFRNVRRCSTRWLGWREDRSDTDDRLRGSMVCLRGCSPILCSKSQLVNGHQHKLLFIFHLSSTHHCSVSAWPSLQCDYLPTEIMPALLSFIHSYCLHHLVDLPLG